MNRIKLSPLATHSPAETVTETPKTANPAPNLFKTNQEEHSLFVPLHYEKKYAYPLIVWLHSDGQSANQVQEVMLELSMRNYVAIAPQSPHGNARSGYFWDQQGDTIEHARNSIDSAIDLASQRCNINHDRIFVAGMGSGGTMAFRLGFAQPDRYAGVISVHGPLPTGHSPLREWSRCRKLPIHWIHGRTEDDFDQDLLCRQLRLLHIAGFTVNLRQYVEVHSLWSKVMADMNRWIMELIDSSVR